MKIKSLGIGICLSLFGTFCLGGCSGSSPQPVSRTVTVFDTVVTITVYDKDSEDVLDACVTKCEDYNARFSRTSEGSEIYELNHANGEPVTLSGDTVDLIQKGVEYSRLADGKFDITIAPLSDLWDFKNNTGTVPDDTAIQEAKSHIGYENVRVDGNTVQLLDPEAAIDLGGIAKGYIADVLTELYQKNGVERALINLGGNIRTIGEFTLGIRDPQGESDDYVCTITLKDSSIVTSGAYIRNFEQDGVVYHHILDPKMGKPAESDLLSVSMVCTESAVADAYSTAVYVLGEKEGLALVERTEGAECLLVTEDNRVVMSSGFKAQCAPQFADGTSYTWE